MKKIGILLVLMALLNFGCAGFSRNLEFNSVATGAFVFGYIDTKDMPCNMDWIEYKQVLPSVEKPYFYFRTDKGAFYREDLVPGSFQLADFGGRGKPFLFIFPSNTNIDVSFPVQDSGFRVKEAGRFYYLGSYKAKDKGDFFKADFHVEPIEHPNEREVLEMILPRAKGNPWEPLIEQKIEQLKSQEPKQ